jgi:hypothetical protein
LFDSINVRLILGEKKRNLVIVGALFSKSKQQNESKHPEKKPKNSPEKLTPAIRFGCPYGEPKEEKPNAHCYKHSPNF